MTARRITHALTVAALALGALAGCGDGDPEPGIVTTRTGIEDRRGGGVKICIRQDRDGQVRCLVVRDEGLPGCDEGKRWPACQG